MDDNDQPLSGDAPLGPARPARHRTDHPERRKRSVGWQSRDIIRTVALVLAVFYGFKLLWVAQQLVLASFLGILFGLAVAAGVDRLERFRIPRAVGAALVVLVFLASLAGFGVAVAPTLREQATELRQRLPEALDRAESWMEARRGGMLGVLLRGMLGGPDTPADGAAGGAPAGAPGGVAGEVAATPAPADSPPAVASGDSAPSAAAGRPGTAAGPATGAPAGAAAGPEAGAEAGPPPPRAADVAAGADADNDPPSFRDRIGEQLGGATRYLFPFLSSTVAVVAGILLIIFLAIYTAANPGLYRRGVMHLVPHRHRPRAGEVMDAMGTTLRRWLVTQLIAMVAIGAVSTVVLMLLDVPAAFALGVIAGLLEFIPTVGPIISAIPAIAMGFVVSPEKALWVLLAYIGIQAVESHLLTPLLMQEGMDLPPALTILAQALMALLFGFLGLMCAVPILAASMVAVKMLYVEGVVGDTAFAPDEDPRRSG
jgi:predicted PurR-regulated permease PerM